LNRYTSSPSADNPGKWDNAEYDGLVAKIGLLAPGDKRIPALFRQALAIWLRELPVIPLTQRPEPIVVNSTYWTGWPSSTHNYTYPAPWGQNFHQVILKLKAANAK
jgi:peptide/nickel transport system substrate-binding protein